MTVLSPLKTFLKEPSCSTSYSFRLKNCSSPTCKYCVANKPTLPHDTLLSLSWPPLPLLDQTKEHYRSFVFVYGSLISSKDQPSISAIFNSMEAAAADEQNSELFNATRVCGAIQCQECFKPRCILNWQVKKDWV